MTRSIFTATLIATSCLVAASAASAQTIYTDRAAFEAATTNRTVSTFEGVVFDEGGNAPSKFLSRSFTGNGYTITNNEFMFINRPSGSYNYNSGNILSVNDGTGLFSINSNFSAFGFDYGKGSQGSGSLDLFINNVAYQSIRPNLGFFGIVGSPGLASISFRTNGGIGVFDNVTTAMAAAGPITDPIPTAVPEPATWAMMLAGFAMVGTAMRVRTRRIRFA